MRRYLHVIALLSCVIVPLSAQAPATSAGPDGWKVRVDRSQDAQDPDNTQDLTFVARGNGFQVTGGPAGTFWHPARTASGNFNAKATFTLLKPSDHTNYYGLVFGGRELDGTGQTYLYFVVAQNGTFQIRHRAGETVNTVQGRTAHQAIRRPGTNGQSSNVLEVKVAGGTVSYLVNGTVVHTAPKSGPLANTDGIVGVRVNHVLDVHVEGFEVQRS